MVLHYRLAPYRYFLWGHCQASYDVACSGLAHGNFLAGRLDLYNIVPHDDFFEIMFRVLKLPFLAVMHYSIGVEGIYSI